MALYRIVPVKFRNYLLLLLSLFFIAWGNPADIILIGLSIVFNYFTASELAELRSRQKTALKKFVLATGISANVALLIFFKYFVFLLNSFGAIIGTNFVFTVPEAPIGISFFTFSAISCLCDVSCGDASALRNPADFALYITFFGKITSGPIVKFRDMAAQIQSRDMTADSVESGIRLFILGMSKKLIIAGSLGKLFYEIKAQDVSSVSAITAWLGALFYSLMLYYDFSGYSDMAIGLGGIFGFDFSKNFDHPYVSLSMSEFWRRWHISLGSWFREYLYISLGGNRRGLPRQMLNLFIVWGLTGLWHGAGWNFVIWGLYFFLLLAAEKLFLLDLLRKAPAVVGHIYTLLSVLISWVIFACDDIGKAWEYILSMFGANGFADASSAYYLRENLLIILAGGILSVSFVRRYAARKINSLQSESLRFGIKTAVGAGLYLFSLLMVIESSYNPFLYFRF